MLFPVLYTPLSSSLAAVVCCCVTSAIRSICCRSSVCKCLNSVWRRCPSLAISPMSRASKSGYYIRSVRVTAGKHIGFFGFFFRFLGFFGGFLSTNKSGHKITTQNEHSIHCSLCHIVFCKLQQNWQIAIIIWKTNMACIKLHKKIKNLKFGLSGLKT